MSEDLAEQVRMLPPRREFADCYQAIVRHVPTGVAGWAIGYSREGARDKAMAFLARAVEKTVT
jgi:hypothetical protein